jgi:hypothetical protein
MGWASSFSSIDFRPLRGPQTPPRPILASLGVALVQRLDSAVGDETSIIAQPEALPVGEALG